MITMRDDPSFNTLDALPDAIALISGEGVVVGVNEAWSRSGAMPSVIGASSVGSPYLDLCTRAFGEGSEEAREVAINLGHLLAGEFPSFSFKYHSYTSGEERWVDVTVRTVAQSPTVAAIAVHHDRTEAQLALKAEMVARERMAKAIRSADDGRRRLEATLAALPVGVWIANTERETILLVDDEPEVRSLVQRLLRREGYVVLEAGNGADALTLSGAFKSRIHLVISDLYMPGVGGIDIVKELLGRRPDLKALFVSGYADEELVRREIAGLNVPLLRKPFAAADLTLMVRNILDGGAG